jgi:hypothetical protein
MAMMNLELICGGKAANQIVSEKYDFLDKLTLFIDIFRCQISFA